MKLTPAQKTILNNLVQGLEIYYPSNNPDIQFLINQEFLRQVSDGDYVVLKTIKTEGK